MQSKSHIPEPMTDPKTGRLTLSINYIPEGTPLDQLLHDLADRMATMIEQATADGRKYDLQIKILADVTVDSSQAEVGEYVSELSLQVPDEINTVETDRIVFERTAVGWRRTK